MDSDTRKGDVQPGALPVSAEVDLWPRPRRNRHHRIDAACGHNFCYPAHKIIPMEGQNHLREMQRYVANVAITPSTFRKLGAGFVEAAQEFLASLNLKQLANLEPSEYPKWLEDQTQALMASFPIAERWGPARKSINIFMVMASLNQFLCDEYKLHRFGYVLEVPLDNTVTKNSVFSSSCTAGSRFRTPESCSEPGTASTSKIRPAGRSPNVICLPSANSNMSRFGRFNILKTASASEPK